MHILVPFSNNLILLIFLLEGKVRTQIEGTNAILFLKKLNFIKNIKIRVIILFIKHA